MKPALSVIKTKKQQANENTVEILEEILAAAKEGEFESVVAVAFRPDSTCSSYASASLENTKKLGAIEVLKFDLLNRMND